jgi:hypothetical protein
MSLWSVAFQGTTPIGGPLVGWIAGELGARYGLGSGAAAAIIVGGVGIVTFRRRDPWDAAAADRADPPVPPVAAGAPPDGVDAGALATAAEPAG